MAGDDPGEVPSLNELSIAGHSTALPTSDTRSGKAIGMYSRLVISEGPAEVGVEPGVGSEAQVEAEDLR